MGSRRPRGSIMDDCMQWISTKQTEQTRAEYGTNLISSRQALDQQQHENAQIKNFGSQLEKLKSSKHAAADVTKMESNYGLLQEISRERQKCLESLLYVSELEDYYQNLSAEIDTRALELSGDAWPTGNVDPAQDRSAISRTFNACIYAVRGTWQWLSQVNYCLDTHLRNAAEYQQFFHEVKHCDQGMRAVTSWLRHHTYKREQESKDVQQFIRDIRDVIQQLLDYQVKVERLFRTSGDVVPLKLRKQPVTTPVKLHTLVDYQHQEFSVRAMEDCLLLDNKEETKWKVRNSQGADGYIPAIVFVIPPPDREAVMNAQRVRQQLGVTWRESLAMLRLQVRRFLNKYLNDHKKDELKVLNPGVRSEILKFLGDMVDVLDPNGENKAEAKEFRRLVEEWKTAIPQMRGVSVDRHGASSTLQLQWKGNQKLVRQIEEMGTYAKQYEDDVAATRGAQNILIEDVSGDTKYVSKAYIERLKPCEVDDKETDMKTRNLSLSERLPTPPEKPSEDWDVSVHTTSESTEEDMFSSQTIRETKTFVIKGVIDPRNQDEISIYRAIQDGVISQTQGLYRNPETGQSMPIPEAMNRGLIKVEYTNKSVEQDAIKRGVITTTTTMETVAYSVLSVIDPETGKPISVTEAVARGIIDQTSGRYINPITGKSMSIMDAIEKGLIDVEVADQSSSSDTVDGLIEAPEAKYSDKDFVVLGVFDPLTNKELSLERAILGNLIDKEKGTYRDPRTLKVMSIAEAIQRGLIRTRLADPFRDQDNPDVVRARILQLKSDSVQSLINPETAQARLSKAKPMDINHSIFNKLKDKVDTSTPGIREQVSGKEMTIGEAFEKGILGLDPVHIANADGDKYSLHEAAALGLISQRAAKEILKGCEANSLDKLIESRTINAETGQFTDPNTGEVMSIKEAIERGLLDPDTVFFIDGPSHNVMSLSSAIQNKKFDPETGKFIDPKTGREMTMAEAIKANLVNPEVDAEKLTKQISALKFLRAFMDTSSTKGIKNAQTGEDISVEDAILSGVLDIANVDYVNLDTQQSMSLPQAVDAKLVDAKTAKSIMSAISKMSLGEALAQSQIDPHMCKYIHPETKRRMTIKEAIDNGFLDPYSIFFVDPTNNKVVSLGSFIEDGRFNPVTGKFKDPLTNLEININNAINKGIINPVIDPDLLIEEKCTLQELMNSGKVRSLQAPFVTPDGQKMALKDGLAMGYLTPASIVKIDPKTGNIEIAGDLDTVKTMIDIKKKLDTIAIVETALAKQGKPSEEKPKLEEQQIIHQNIKKDVDKQKEPIEKLLKRAQELLENNKDTSKDNAAQQQYQRLRFNTSDLKVRFEAVNQELDTRLQRLDGLLGNLEDFHQHLDNFDGWLTHANSELEQINGAIADVDRAEELAAHVEDFTNDALAREDDLQAVNRSANNFKNQAKDFEKDGQKFRRGLQQKVDPPVEDPSKIIDTEIAAANEKFKAVLGDCTSLMAKLGETAEKNKTYNELKSRLEDWLPGIEARVRRCSSDITPGGDHASQEEELKGLTADVISEGKLVEDLRNVGNDLLSVLEALDCGDTPKARAIQNTIDSVQARYDQIQEDVVDKQHKLNAAIAESQDIHHNIDSVLAWIAETEEVFNNMKPVSLAKSNLSDQIQAHRVLSSDIENHIARIESLTEEAENQPGTEMKIEELHERFNSLQNRAEARANELEEVVQKLGTLHGNVNQLESWLANAVHSLKRESTDFDQATLKQKIENLYKQKQNKEADLEKIKAIGNELISDPNTGDKNQLRETLADVQGKWHDLTELLVQMISFAALREIDDLLRYLDKAENEINTAEPISTDPETLAVQLRDHKAFHEDLENKRKAVNETIDKCNKMLRETTSEEADDIKNKLDTIRNQADLVCKLSNERLALLEEALPLASHFSETHADLQSWLGEIEAEIDSLDVPADGNVEQIKKQQDNAKTTQRIIEDHKPLVEDLNNTGQELMEMCTDEDASDLKEDVDNVNAKYDEVKAAVREKLNGLDEAYRNVSSEIGETVDGLLEELHYLSDQVQHADPIAANAEQLKEQIAEINTIVGDLERRQVAIDSAKETVQGMLEQQNTENAEECDDLRSKMGELENLQLSILDQTQDRARKLDEAVVVADKFAQDYQEVIRALRDIQDNLVSQDSPGVDPATIREQQRELQAIEEDLQHCRIPLEECQKTAGMLATICGTPGKMELQKHMEDVDTALEEIEDGVKERQEELASALDKAEQYERTLQAVMSWLPRAEEKLKSMSPIAAEARAVRIQIEELKVFKVQVHPQQIDIQNLNQYASELKNASPVTAESLGPQVKDINQRWNDLINAMSDRECGLKDTLVQLGEVDHALDDVLGFLQQTESELSSMDDIYGDPKYIEAHLKRLQLVQQDLKNQEPTMKKLNEAVDQIVARSAQGSNRVSPLKEKQEEMNELYKTVHLQARDRKNELQDILKKVKQFMGEVEDLTRWLNEFRQDLKSSSPLGALPDTAQKQFDKFMQQYGMLEQKEEAARALLLNGEDMIARCRATDSKSLMEGLSRLKERMHDTRRKAHRKKRKLEEHLENVKDFHAMLKIHTDWLNNAEKILGSFKFPSKLVERVLKQIQEHKSFKEDIEAHREIMQNLDRTGTYLKYFGAKKDTVYIKNLLISIKLRWKKLVRRADEKGRLLQQAHKEDKRFYDAWKGLCDWLEDGEKKLKRFTTGAAAKVKQDIDELKHFNHQMSAKHPSYYSTMRLGRSLKDRCTKSDPEREILQTMLEDLKNKWNILRSIVAQRQNKLDEALLSSGRFTDAMQSLLEWLQKAESYLAEDQPILGDLDTTTILIEQHKAFQQELESRQGMIQAIKSAPNPDQHISTQLDELSNLWDRVNQLSEVRETRLQEALKLAEEFYEAVQVVREWLPQAEAELKFRPLPEDENNIVALIESHDRFQEELRGQQPNVEKIRYLAEEILQACHPNAVRFVKYYLTITQTRWEQALNRSNQRAQRLLEALRAIRGNAALLEELLAWLTEAQALLAAKEKDPIPEDLTVVETLVKEHLEFHEDLSAKNKDVDKLTKLPAGKDAKRAYNQYGSNWKLNESEGPSPRVTTLQNKWRSVWRMSVDRKKKLQDALDHLLELESFKNFNFDLWRQRYVNWIRAKKFRITDFFRRQDKDQDGVLTRKEFVEGMLVSKFPTNKTELNAVFDIFDRNGSEGLDYKEFVDALRPDRHRGNKKRATESEMISDEIEQQVSRCQCRHQFRAKKVGEGKYKFGENQKLRLVRFLNSTVMVRVGGGWVTMNEFLEQNDPCRAKGRSNFELRDQLLLPDGAHTPTRRKGSTPGARSARRSEARRGSDASVSSVEGTPAGSSGNIQSTPTSRRLSGSASGESTPTSTKPRRVLPGTRARSPAPTRGGARVNGTSTPTSTRSRSPGRPTTPARGGRTTPKQGWRT